MKLNAIVKDKTSDFDDIEELWCYIENEVDWQLEKISSVDEMIITGQRTYCPYIISRKEFPTQCEETFLEQENRFEEYVMIANRTPLLSELLSGFEGDWTTLNAPAKVFAECPNYVDFRRERA